MIGSRIKQVQGQTRTLKDALSSRYGVKIPEDHECLPWLIRHAAFLRSRLKKDDSGRTPYEKWKGKPFKAPLVEFGERVMYYRSDAKGKEKLDTRWNSGIWLGVMDNSHEIIIGTSSGCLKSREVRRYADDADRWNLDAFQAMQGVPWQPVPGLESEQIKVKIEVPKLKTEFSETPQGTQRPFVSRRFRINRKDFDDIGFTPLCPGCTALIRGLPS